MTASGQPTVASTSRHSAQPLDIGAAAPPILLTASIEAGA